MTPAFIGVISYNSIYLQLVGAHLVPSCNTITYPILYTRHFWVADFQKIDPSTIKGESELGKTWKGTYHFESKVPSNYSLKETIDWDNSKVVSTHRTGTHPEQPLPTGHKEIPFIVGERGIAWGVL